MKNTCINRKGKQRKSSVRRGARKENWPRRAKNIAVAGNQTLHYDTYTVLYGLDRTYGVYVRSVKTHVRSYGYGYMAYPDTPYICMYGSGQPYITGMLFPGQALVLYHFLWHCGDCPFDRRKILPWSEQAQAWTAGAIRSSWCSTQKMLGEFWPTVRYVEGC
jgi:hypothetical protein